MRGDSVEAKTSDSRAHPVTGLWNKLTLNVVYDHNETQYGSLESVFHVIVAVLDYAFSFLDQQV